MRFCFFSFSCFLGFVYGYFCCFLVVFLVFGLFIFFCQLFPRVFGGVFVFVGICLIFVVFLSSFGRLCCTLLALLVGFCFLYTVVVVLVLVSSCLVTFLPLFEICLGIF